VIDPDFEGTIKVVLFNHGKNPFSVSKRDRVAQLILDFVMTETVYNTDIEGVEERAVGVIPYIIKEP
jgi:dUTP pyrophosphatase